MRLLIPFLLVALVACGGDDGDADAEPSGSPAGSGTEAAATPASTAAEDAPSGPAGVTVTIGTETFEFDTIGGPGCVRVGGQVSGGSDMTSANVKVSFTIPPEDWETDDRFNKPPSLAVFDRRADPAFVWDARGLGTVDSYTIDEHGVSGTATFVSQKESGSNDLVSETVSGTFDVSCGG